MKKTFTIKLDTEISIDFSVWGLSDAQQKGGNETRKLVIDHFIEQNGMDEFEISEKNSNSLFDAMTEVIKAQNDYALLLAPIKKNGKDICDIKRSEIAV